MINDNVGVTHPSLRWAYIKKDSFINIPNSFHTAVNHYSADSITLSEPGLQPLLQSTASTNPNQTATSQPRPHTTSDQADLMKSLCRFVVVLTLEIPGLIRMWEN